MVQVPQWGAVWALTLCVATPIASEFMPISLLTPIATDLGMTEGRVGQAFAVSGIFAVLTSLLIASATRGINRRIVLLALTLLMMASGVIVAFAPNGSIFMVGRALIGIVIGGFWSMSAATVMRLVPEADVPRVLGVLNGGNALATTVAAPLGSFLGQYIGWRGAFFCVVPLAALTLAWLIASLPSMPSERGRSGGSVFRVLRRRYVPLGMLAVTLFFLGQFALYTYVRPFLETVTHVDVSTLSLLLLISGSAGLLGTYLIGIMLQTRLYSLLIVIPLVMATIAVALMVLGGLPIPVGILLAAWGLTGTAAPVGWWTWLSKVLPDDAAHNSRPKSVVLGVVGRVDGGVYVRSGLGEGHIPFQATGANATGAAGLRAAVARVGRAVGRADVEIVAGPNDPHRHIGAERAIRA
ncbi:MAG TPA: MFS transporter [Roseiflexaceae bacterium]|nr:MFS transporter [Roseiflexaceae bacterium]